MGWGSCDRSLLPPSQLPFLVGSDEGRWVKNHTMVKASESGSSDVTTCRTTTLVLDSISCCRSYIYGVKPACHVKPMLMFSLSPNPPINLARLVIRHRALRYSQHSRACRGLHRLTYCEAAGLSRSRQISFVIG